jgi:hypothetical protein
MRQQNKEQIKGAVKKEWPKKEGPQVHKEPVVLLFVLKFNLR